MIGRFVAVLALAVAGVVAAPRVPAAAELKVVATIKPIHALAAELLEGAGAARVLVDGNASPHTYALKPSDAKAVHSADVLVRVSEAVEPFTARLIPALPKSVAVVTLAKAPGVRLLEKRTSPTFEVHKHARHEHAHGHADSGADGHLWLDPRNAVAMVRAMAAAFAAKAPSARGTIEANAARLIARIEALDAELEQELKPLSGKPFVVFHDAYQYLEARYGLAAAGSITLNPDQQPSARRISEVRAKIIALGAVCVFGEPQFTSRLLEAVTEGTKARVGTLDPEGGQIAPGGDHYFSLMRALARGLKSCLAG